MWTIKDMPEQSAKDVLITGANSGIGLEMARAFYQKGANVIMAARDEEKALCAVNEIKAGGGSGQLNYELIDLADLSDIKRFARSFGAKYGKLDILINNAGVMTPPASKTADGYELQFGVNFLAHFALTGMLYPFLKQVNGARVVTLSSGAHHLATGVDFDNVRSEISYDPNREYAISKLADLQFAMEFQRRIDRHGDNLMSLAAHPGVTQSGLARHMSKDTYDAALAQFGELMPAWQGALPALYAATSEEVKGGGYYGPDGPNELKGYPATAAISEIAQERFSAGKLWDFGELATSVYFPTGA